MGIVGFVAGVAIASHLVRRIENKIDPPRSWVAVKMESRTVPYGLEVSDSVTAVYLLVMIPVFIVLGFIMGALGVVAAGAFGAFVTLVVATGVSHVMAMSVTEWCVDQSVKELMK